MKIKGKTKEQLEKALKRVTNPAKRSHILNALKEKKDD